MMEIWAKDNGELLDEHIEKCLQVWQRLWQTKYRSFCRLAEKIGLDSPEKLNLLVKETIICHDLGKGTHRWQQYIRSKGKKGKITHTLFSFCLYGDVRQWPKNDIYFTAAALAILGHHQMLHTDVFAHNSFENLGLIEIYNRELEKIVFPRLKNNNGLRERIKGYESVERVQHLKQLAARIINKEDIFFKRIYCIFLAILTYVDNVASGGYGFEFIKPMNEIWQGFKNSQAALNPNELQKEIIKKVKEGNKNFLVQAGCGSGKTGAALLAGLELVKEGWIDKVIFTLPTKFTSNSMYWDFTADKYKFEPRDVGIYHSEIEALLVQDKDDEDEDYLRFIKNLNCWYAKPLNISTIDHLLYSLLHCYRYADRAFGHLQTSLVVFDEIHYYDKYLLAKIGQCIQILRQLSIPHIVMSATLPPSLQDALKEEAEIDGCRYEPIQVLKPHDHAPCKIRLEKLPLIIKDNVNERFIERVGKNLDLRQMVVVNQVERAKLVTKKIREIFKDVNVICYHSEFTKLHKEKKEKLIKILFKNKEERSKNEIEFLEVENFTNSNQVILVTTQICELSLDISAHVMYSEIAPIDSLIQRAGRLHRKGRNPSSEKCGCEKLCKHLQKDHLYELFVYPIDWQDKFALLPYSDNPEENILRASWSILENSEAILTEPNTVEWVKQLYQDEPKLTDREMMRMIREDLVFGRKPEERFGDDSKEHSQGSFRVRENIRATLVVVPESLYSPSNPEESLELHGVQVGRNKVLAQEGKYASYSGIWILNLPYNEELGFEFSR